MKTTATNYDRSNLETADAIINDPRSLEALRVWARRVQLRLSGGRVTVVALPGTRQASGHTGDGGASVPRQGELFPRVEAS